MSDQPAEEKPASGGDEPTGGPEPLDATSPPPSDSSEDVVVEQPAPDAPAAASSSPGAEAPAPAPAEPAAAPPAPTPEEPPPAKAAPARPGPARPTPVKPVARPAASAPATAKPAATPAPAPAPAKPAAAKPTPAKPEATPAPRAAVAPPARPAPAKDGTGRAKRPATKSGVVDAAPERASGVGTGRKKRPARADDEGEAPRGPSPALLAVGGGLVGALVVAIVMVVLLRPSSPPPAPPDQAQQPTETPPSAPQDDGAASWRRLNGAQEKLAALQEETDPAAVKRGLERLERDLKALRASSIAREASGTLDRLERQLAALRERDDDAAASSSPAGDARPRGEREAKLASIDEGLSELAFVVEARLFSALQAVPRSILHAAAEEQQGRGLRDRLRRSVRDASGVPRALIEVALRPEFVGLLGAAGYQQIEAWAVDYVGEFRTSDAWRYWETEQLPRLTESKARAERFQAALEQVEAAWEAKDHAAALAALAPFRDSRYEIWGTALLGWVEQEEVQTVWGARPLRPRPDEPARGADREPDAPRARGSGTGFFVTARVLLTNEHVVQDAETVRVQMQEHDEVRGKVIAKHADLDLALVEVEGLEGKPLGFCKDSLAVGESVYVYGYGAMITGTGVTNEQAVWTVGALSQFQKDGDRRLIVFDASVNPGNSGGPLIDCGGNWIGVVVAKTRSLEWIDGYGYAVHGDDARRWVDEQLGGRGKVATATAPDQPLRASVIARRLPASVVRIVVGE